MKKNVSRSSWSWGAAAAAASSISLSLEIKRNKKEQETALPSSLLEPRACVVAKPSSVAEVQWIRGHLWSKKQKLAGILVVVFAGGWSDLNLQKKEGFLGRKKWPQIEKEATTIERCEKWIVSRRRRRRDIFGRQKAKKVGIFQNRVLQEVSPRIKHCSYPIFREKAVSGL